jgi:hypothetical protein
MALSQVQAQAPGYVGVGPAPAPLWVGQFTVMNRGPNDVKFLLSGAGCPTAVVQATAKSLVTFSCGEASTVTTLLRTKRPDGVELERLQTLATRAHYDPAVDGAGALILNMALLPPK